MCVGAPLTPKGAPIVHAVYHEIQGPNLIELLIVFKWLSLPRDNTLLGLAF
jgi:hypothetical protein